jgi:hypothetical protein
MATELLVWGIVAHLIADWIFQNHWMAINKANLTHPAAWVHGFIHLVAALCIFTPLYAFTLAFVHILIDTRIPIKFWQRFYKQTTEGAYAIPVQIWLDQVFHIVVIAALAVAATGEMSGVLKELLS